MENKLTYLYLDDNDRVTREGDVELINNVSSRIIIKTEYPNSWHIMSNQILNNLEDINGIIFDWELTNKSEDAKNGCEDVDYSAESLAEHIRVSITLNNKKDIPIILCSANKNNSLSSLRKKEHTSNDLFDLTFIKNDLFYKNVDDAEAQLYDLAQIYNVLQSKKLKNIEIFNLSIDELEYVDFRFIDYVDEIYNNKSTHDFVQFLLREFIEKEGILIDENILIARLGIDKEKSGQSWQKLKEIIFDNLIYKGVLSVGWENFWGFKLEKWWSESIHSENLRLVSANKRVELLNERLGLDLKVSEKIKYCNSNEFWTVCYATKKPLDPVDGYMIANKSKYPWQEIQYVSAYGELEKVSDNWKISISDRDNFNRFKALIAKLNNKK